MPFTTELPYPAKPDDFDRFWQVVEQRVNAAGNLKPDEKTEILANGRKQLEDYFHGGGRREAISTNFNRVSESAQTNHLYPGQIFMGEFGVTQKGPDNDGALPRTAPDGSPMCGRKPRRAASIGLSGRFAMTFTVEQH